MSEHDEDDTSETKHKEHSEHKNHKTHKEVSKHKSKGSSFGGYMKSNPWQISTVVLAILLLVSIYTDGFSSVSMPSVSTGGGKAIEQYKQYLGDAQFEGKKDAQVLMVEFSDFQCPFCKRFYDQTYLSLKKDYIDTGKVAFAYRHFPLGFHQNAQKAAEAFECAGEQKKQWEMHNAMFEKGSGDGTGLNVEDLKKYAKDMGLDSSKFDSCIDTGKYASKVQKDLSDGQSFGVEGTPTFFINGEKVVGAQPYASIKAVIDKKLSGDDSVPAQAQPTQPTPQAAPAPSRIENPNIDDDPIKGKKDAKVTIIEWSDFQCPFCKRFYEQTLPSIQKEYIDTGKVRLVFRDFPLGFHQNAQKAAEAGECADEQGKFWEMHNTMFEKGSGDGTGLNVDDLKKYAKDLGLDTKKFDSCLDSGKYASEITKDTQEGQTYGITGTPGFLVNGVPIKGAVPFANFKAVIDVELAK